MKKLALLFSTLLLVSCQSGDSGHLPEEVLAIVCERVLQAAAERQADARPAMAESDGCPEADMEHLELPAIGQQEQLLRRKAYTASYDAKARLPRWVAWRLTAEHTEGSQPRLSNFHPDEEVAAPRAEPADYKGSGYDRGHMCPAGDNKWGYEPMRESFLLTNVCPQDQHLNSGDWNELEAQCREWAKKYEEIFIVCGPIMGKGKQTTIGANRVKVPDAFFKVVLCIHGHPKGLGFVYKNQRCNHPMPYYLTTIDDVEQLTGIDFFPSLPDDVETAVEASSHLEEW